VTSAGGAHHYFPRRPERLRGSGEGYWGALRVSLASGSWPPPDRIAKKWTKTRPLDRFWETHPLSVDAEVETTVCYSMFVSC